MWCCARAVPLIAGAPAESLYEWSGGRLALVSVLPGGALAATASIPGLGHSDVDEGIDERDTVSVDGSRVVWSEGRGKRGLYLRDMGTGETVLVGPAGSVFATASVDDSRVFFVEGGDLFVFVVTSGAGEALAGRVVRVTEGAGLLGTVIGASGDGSDVFFVGDGVLAGGAQPGGCQGEGRRGAGV